MKRVIALVLSMVFALLTGCGTTAAPPVSEPEPAPVSVSEPHLCGRRCEGGIPREDRCDSG